MKKFIEWFKGLLESCFDDDSFLWEFYAWVVGELECPCCIFYRGVGIGIILTGCVFLLYSIIANL